MIKINIKVEGMSCGMCETHINDAIRRNFEVKKVSSSRSDKETVIITENDIPDDKIKAVIGALGYGVMGIERSAYEKKKFSLFKTR